MQKASMKHPSRSPRRRVRALHVVALAVVAVVVVIFAVAASVLTPVAEAERPSPSKWARVSFGGGAKPSLASGTPALKHVFMPFKDLCYVAAKQQDVRTEGPATLLGRLEHYVSPPQQEVAHQQQQRKEEVMNITSRFDHVPATGGASAERWSGATGLPMKSDRVGEVKVRFVTSSNRLGPFEQTATTAAAMVGVRFEVVGLHWKHFSYLKRMGMMLSYAEVEGLKDSDVIAGVDSDALFSGEDPYSLFEAFVASTAESLEEHRTYSVRDIRFGKRLPPVVFGAEFNCMRVQALRKGEKCESAYSKVNDAAAKWSRQQNVALPNLYTERNPFRFLNAGVFIARVWALREFNAAAQQFMRHHPPKRNGAWWCDQSAMGTLYLDLLMWEILSGALDGTSKPLTEKMLKESVYPPMLLPKEGDGPNGLPGGLVGIDTSERFVLNIGAELSRLKFFRVGTHVVRRNKNPEGPLQKYQKGAYKKTQNSVMGVPESTHRINIKPRNGVDCAGVADRPPECAYRDAVLGIPIGAPAVVPLTWHFAGRGMKPVAAHYRGLFPWYTPTVQNGVALRRVVETLLDAPPTRVFEVDNATDFVNLYQPVGLRPYDPVHDLPFMKMCDVLVRK